MVSLVDVIVFSVILMCVFDPRTALDLPELSSSSVYHTMQDSRVQKDSKYLYSTKNPPVGGGLFTGKLTDNLRRRTLVVRPLPKIPPSISFEGPAGYDVIVSIQVIKTNNV
ncbi:hypothetical protein ACJMK2_012492 [Sinanodonta woodiana]|uniref:Uncharacterized protein n=1 Tax=Sinanodonta woodiana TaxID=1069815 RepID=A0ABD3V8D8_SINWO